MRTCAPGRSCVRQQLGLAGVLMLGSTRDRRERHRPQKLQGGKSPHCARSRPLRAVLRARSVHCAMDGSGGRNRRGWCGDDAAFAAPSPQIRVPVVSAGRPEPVPGCRTPVANSCAARTSATSAAPAESRQIAADLASFGEAIVAGGAKLGAGQSPIQHRARNPLRQPTRTSPEAAPAAGSIDP
jgi:hypothetical protein